MNVSAKLAFRLALAAYVLLTLGVIAQVLIIGPGELPAAAAAYLSWFAQQPQSPVEQLVGWVSLVVVVVSIVSALGMVVFARWARVLFAISVGILLVSEAFMALPVLKTSCEQLFDSIAGILSGAIVVFSYWSSVTNEFSRSAP